MVCWASEPDSTAWNARPARISLVPLTGNHLSEESPMVDPHRLVFLYSKSVPIDTLSAGATLFRAWYRVE